MCVRRDMAEASSLLSIRFGRAGLALKWEVGITVLSFLPLKISPFSYKTGIYVNKYASNKRKMNDLLSKNDAVHEETHYQSRVKAQCVPQYPQHQGPSVQ